MKIKRRLPHLYEKLLIMAQACEEMDYRVDVKKNILKQRIASRFRLTQYDVDQALREVERKKKPTPRV